MNINYLLNARIKILHLVGLSLCLILIFNPLSPWVSVSTLLSGHAKKFLLHSASKNKIS